MGDQKFGIEHRACQQIAHSIKEVHSLGVQMGIVVGGGNIFRGSQADAFGFARTPADHIGMLISEEPAGRRRSAAGVKLATGVGDGIVPRSSSDGLSGARCD